MHACIKECNVIDTKKEVVFMSVTCHLYQNINILFMKVISCGYFVRQFQSCCRSSSKAVVTDFVSEKPTTECIVTAGSRYSADLLLQML